tara:strand:+ start:359 stop:634 length:276 start_codon:yes stop_codon:yes gene_type:complete
MANILYRALDKIDRNTLDQMSAEETIVLNERYELYSYLNDERTKCFVIIDTDKSVYDEIFVVQYADYKNKNNKDIVFTDIYGYEEIEETLT